MSNQSGFDYDVMISRLHGGLCAFQSLRAHRRERAQAAAPPPEVRRTPEPPPAARVAHVDDLFSVAATGPVTTPSDPPPTPPSAPAPAAPPSIPPPAAAEPRPTAPAATLRLPPPTPPPQLGLILGGRPATPESGAVTEPPTAIRPQAPDAPPTTVAAASLRALLDARAQEDAQRLERAHAEHHAAMATLQREHQEALRAQREADATRTTALLRDVFAEHRAQLRAQSEADAARTAGLLRDVFAEHRAELAQANQAHADLLAQRPQSADPPAPDLRAALLEQANVQREANEAVAENIDALTSIVADLGQTVGMLAVAATQKTQQAQRSVQAIFPRPPRVEPVHAAAPDPASSRPAVPHVDPAATATSATSPHLEPANCGPSAAASLPLEPVAPTSTQATPAATNPPTHASLADAITSEAPQPRTIGLKLAQEAAALARVELTLAEDDDPDLETALDDDDDPERHRRLAPCTDIESNREQGDD